MRLHFIHQNTFLSQNIERFLGNIFIVTSSVIIELNDPKINKKIELSFLKTDR